MGTASALLGEYEACAPHDALTEWLGHTLPNVRHAPAVLGDQATQRWTVRKFNVARTVGALRGGAHLVQMLAGLPPLSTEYVIDQLKQLRELVPASTGDGVDHTTTDGTTW